MRFAMSHSTDRAALIAGQLERLARQNAHQLAGQVANLDFWIAERWRRWP